ncbi:MAG: multicopper oxidase domain-containing protein [Mycobacterium sp.]|nr:multicopper oxidase domain-containing protein [Mycobacterium sp.]
MLVGLLAILAFTVPAGAQNFMVQCPNSTLLHPPGSVTTGSGAGLYDDYNATGVNTLTYTSGGTMPNNYGPHYENYYTGPTLVPSSTVAGVAFGGTTNGSFTPPYVSNGGTVKCQQISGGDGHMTEADGSQTFMFAFGPLSGLDKIAHGVTGSDFPDEFRQPYCNSPTGKYNNGQPLPYSNNGANPLNSSQSSIMCSQNGAVGYVPSATQRQAIGQTVLIGNTLGPVTTATGVAAVILQASPADFPNVTPGAGYTSPPNVTFAPPLVSNGFGTCATVPSAGCVTATGSATVGLGAVIEIAILNPGSGYVNAPSVTIDPPSGNNPIPNTDPAAIMDTGVMNGSIPGPLLAFDEDDEFLLTLTNVGMIMRPDLFEQHTVHFHGYPHASSFYDGVPDATIAINIGASFTYYYMAPDAGTYFWHCHITPPEHLQMGMVAWLYVRPRQNRVPPGTDLYQSVAAAPTASVTYGNGAVGKSQQADPRTACNSGAFATTYGANNIATNGGAGESNLYAGTAVNPSAPAAGTAPDITCSVPSPAADTMTLHGAGWKYVYNDGDGSTRYDIDVPVQMHGFDPNFHFVGMTFNPEGFADMKDKFLLFNGRGYPDTVGVVQQSTVNVGGYVPDGATVRNCAGATATTYAVPCAIQLPTSWTGGLPSTFTGPNPNPTSHAISTMGTDGNSRPTQPAPFLIVLSQTGSVDGAGNPTPMRAALRINNLSVTEYHTLASLSIPLHVVGWMAKMLRDQAGNNLDYYTNSITIGGGESMDAILDACEVRTGPPNYTCTTPVPQGTYFIYTPNLDELSNDAENFGGMMTEVVVTP